MSHVAITGTGVYVPPHTISNEELVTAFNEFSKRFNEKHAAEIQAGSVQARPFSSVEFIVKASGIEQRHVMDKEGLLDVERMRPSLPRKQEGEPSYMAEASVAAAEQALAQAGLTGADLDAVYVSCSTTERDYPGIATEVQELLGVQGFGLDMKMACSSATFGIQMAADTIKAGHAKRMLVVSPELGDGNIDFTDRDSHFIFGSACTAVILEATDVIKSKDRAFEIVSTKLMTKYSDNIKNEFGCFYGAIKDQVGLEGRYFKQNGRKVFKEVVPMASEWISKHISDESMTSGDMKRLWLHQANINMNVLIAKKILGEEPNQESAPIILNKYANTGACGSVIAFNHYNNDFAEGELGILCSFGAGYSIGSIMLRKL